MRIGRLFAALVTVCAFSSPSSAQLRVTQWNVTNYSSGRVADFQTSIYGVYQGRTMAPDVFVGQEYLSAASVTNFLSILNTAAGSPGDWAAAPFIDGPDTDSAFFYRQSKADFLGMTVLPTGGTLSDPPRNTYRYDIRLKAYNSGGAVLACYSSHMKSGTASSDQSRRLIEAQRIRDNAETLDPSWSFLLAGDFNIQSSSQLAYVELVGGQTNNAGRFFDPINTPGSWNNNSVFRIVHTQDPTGAGGMDDRHDQVLLCGKLVDGDGFDYIGNPAMPYSTTTWDDPNHSYRAWGNDGTAFNLPLTIAGNQMVGSVIAQALANTTLGQGHLPVFLDLRVPPKVDSPAMLEFGQVALNSIAEQMIVVTNSADATLWSAAGIADLRYSLTAGVGFSAPLGTFIEPADGSGNAHVISMDTSTVGLKSGTLTLTSNAPDEPSRVVTLQGEVVLGICDPANVNCDAELDFLDADALVNLLLNGAPPCSSCAGDLNQDNKVDGDDIPPFIRRLVP